MRRITIEIIEDTSNGRLRIEANAPGKDKSSSTDSEDKMCEIVKGILEKVLQHIPGLAGVGKGDNISECRDSANLQADIYEAWKPRKPEQ